MEAELAGCGDFDETCKDRVRYSQSLGVLPKQFEQARAMHPGAEFVKLPGERAYRMVIHNRAEKVKRMKERGMVELDKNRGDW